MKHGFESSKNQSLDQVAEVPERSFDNNRLEKKEVTDNYDDCLIMDEYKEEEIQKDPDTVQNEFDKDIYRIPSEIAEEYEVPAEIDQSEAERKEAKQGRASLLKEACVEKDIQAEMLVRHKEEQKVLEKEKAEKFDAVMQKENGTEEYRIALQEYNDARNRQAELAFEVEKMEKDQAELGKKIIELREAQFRKGERAIAESDVTLAASSELQERFDAEIYKKKPNIKELSSIQEANSRNIAELVSQRDAVHLAMEAKMSELDEHIRANNLERFDSDRDPVCRKIAAEYQALSEVYHRLDYHAIKLDANNFELAELTGKEYESIRYKTGSPIKEVADGTDVPGTTNYFIDEVRTKEVLDSFRQDKWENLTIREQKTAIEDLAAYNADILGIENPPAIVYYKNENPSEFGGFSPLQHCIYINECNIKDGIEVADTVSHEYRHCYQHERAEKLETDRDLEYKEGFDDYIEPENDYEGYKNQFVEKDAQEYAEVIKQKVDNIDNADEYMEDK